MKILTNLPAALAGVVFTAELAAQPTVFTYQGELHDNAQPASGIYELRFALYDSAGGGVPIAGPITNSPVSVSNGLFTVTLDFGPGVFTGARRWLEIGVRDGGSNGAFEVLGARQPLTPAPYALHAYSVSGTNITGTVPIANLPPNLVRSDGAVEWTGPVRFLGPVEFDQSSGPPFAVVSSTDLVPGLNAELLDGRSAQGFWQTGGNAGTTPATHFIGTSDNQPLELKVNNQRAIRIEPTTGAPNIIGGHPANIVTPGLSAVTIGGGGSATEFHRVTAGGATIGGGVENRVDGIVGTVGGGQGNMAASPGTTVSGGAGNLATNDYAFVGGGIFNRASGTNATVVGGAYNVASGAGAFVGGGGWDGSSASPNVADGPASIIAGGWQNKIQPYAFYSTIGGGKGNTIQTNADSATIAGGIGNTIQPVSSYSTIAGGYQNTIQIVSLFSTIGGGYFNTIETNANYATIGGGAYNWAKTTSATVAGGTANSAESLESTVGGGDANVARGQAATISGGEMNTAFGHFGTVGGGNLNHSEGDYSTIAGGNGSTVEGYAAAVGGGTSHVISGDYATVGGGRWNRIEALLGTIAGGGGNGPSDRNYVTDEGGSVGGGGRNLAGNTNGIPTDAYYATVAGGWNNQAGGKYAVVPGGLENAALGDLSFAAGRRAKANHYGTFVWADADDTDFPSSGPNQFLIRAAGGVGINTTNPAAPLHVQTGVGQPARIRLSAQGTSAWEMAAGAGNEPSLAFNNGSSDVMTIGYFGNVTATTFNPTSDRNAKDNFEAVDPRTALEKVVAMPVSKWNFKGQPETVHIGPMAQDFHAAFGVGTDDRHIATVDADGVALAAIQGLNQKMEERSRNAEAGIQELEDALQQKDAKIAKLEREVAELRSLVSRALNNSLPPELDR